MISSFAFSNPQISIPNALKSVSSITTAINNLAQLGKVSIFSQRIRSLDAFIDSSFMGGFFEQRKRMV
ncbi:hypothetical protein BLL52_1818 [Rhodoferax antarcticus ANT.BR]|uniref:Uncharacterized protein n=1 Tax=Rhodoferax antarcticus ANT.BR TaxID=1111071 RepID=A0A1Q8YGH5_9BURK|nr:hypothetical protein BLL52_1818 [Rhodoferax antarcticus ANT.BR]